MPKKRVCANNPAVPVISRRAILAAPVLTLVPGAALALPPITKPVSVSDRMDAIAAEMTELIRHVTPEGCGSVHISVGENWNPHEKTRIWWNASCSFYRLEKTLPNGRDFWVSDGIQHMNPRTMAWV